MNSYEHLFSPIQIGTTTVKNRVFMPPISTNLADKGYVTDELVEHYAARAKGGVDKCPQCNFELNDRNIEITDKEKEK